jgi:hypothetical protein
MSFVRPTVLLAAFIYTLTAQLTTAWLVVAGLLWFEMAWFSRCALKACGRKASPVFHGLVGLTAVAAAPGRTLAGLVAAWAWLVLVPVWCVNRNRWKAMRARRRVAVVEQVIQEAESVGLIARGAAALKVLRGARTAPPPPAPSPVSVEVEESAEELTFVHGIRRRLPDGTCMFEELPA